MLKRFTINQTLVISHLLLVLILILGMSLARFNYEWKLHVEQAALRANDVLLYHKKNLSILVDGRNYSNLMLPAQVDAFHAHQNLIFLDIKGHSNQGSKLVHVRYLRDNKRIWREDISQRDIEEFKTTMQRFEELLQQTAEIDFDRRSKLRYILKKATTNYKEAQKSLDARQQFSGNWVEPTLAEDAYEFDSQRYQLHMSVPLINVENGRLWGVFDVSELASIQKQLLKEILFEALLAILISLVLIMIGTRRLVSPIKRLARHMSEQVEDIKIEEIKERHRRDELGDLARSFIALVTEVRSNVQELKEKSETDALTGLGSRHKYSNNSEQFLVNAVLSKQTFALLICDIDNFKAFNDKYGHSEGDNVIQAVSKAILDSADGDDECYRIGGEEFVVLQRYQTDGANLVKAEKIRKAVENLNIEHTGNDRYPVVTISVGMCFLESTPYKVNEISFSQLYNEMFNKADKQLYLAKSQGRNRVVSSKFHLRAYRTLKRRRSSSSSAVFKD